MNPNLEVPTGENEKSVRAVEATIEYLRIAGAETDDPNKQEDLSSFRSHLKFLDFDKDKPHSAQGSVLAELTQKNHVVTRQLNIRADKSFDSGEPMNLQEVVLNVTGHGSNETFILKLGNRPTFERIRLPTVQGQVELLNHSWEL